MEASYQHRQLAHVRHVFHYRDNTLSLLLNPIPIPDPIPRICRVCLNTENLHLELAVGKNKAENPFRDLNATTDAKLLHVLGVVSVFALLRQCFSLSLSLSVYHSVSLLL